jgi:hypothetical protein
LLLDPGFHALQQRFPQRFYFFDAVGLGLAK